ncbi:hypothetical protein AB0F42_16390 [Streptomyces buecherae]|uniref:hypothetical protein n=1 Tax=Streptomyces buecherae TaxID=2763006 RepID=UPI0033EBF699
MTNWTLVAGDWDLVANESGTTRLGFSLLLRFFELEGRFPDVLEEGPPAAVERSGESTGRLDMDKRLDLGLTVPRPRTPADAGRSATETR